MLRLLTLVFIFYGTISGFTVVAVTKRKAGATVPVTDDEGEDVAISAGPSHDNTTSKRSRTSATAEATHAAPVDSEAAQATQVDDLTSRLQVQGNGSGMKVVAVHF